MTTNDEVSDSGVTAWNLDELYDKVADLIIDVEEEQTKTANKFEEVSIKLDELTHAVNCCRQDQSLIDRKLAQQSTITVYHSLALCIWAIAIIAVTNIKGIK